MQKAYRYRIYPTEKQKRFLSVQFGGVRAIFNMMFYNNQIEYETNKTYNNYYENSKLLTILKQEKAYKWLNKINSQSLQASLKNLDTAYQRFFDKISQFPKYHKKHDKQSIKIPQKFYLENNRLYIPKLKTGIKIILNKSLPVKQTCCYISKTKTNKYYVSFACEEEIKPLPQNSNVIGIDLGLKYLITSSNGEIVENPKFLKKKEKKLKYLQRQHSKKKGKKSRERSRIKLAKAHEKVANTRKDYLHKVSKKLINENQVIITENLSVNNMLKNHCLAKSISDVGWGELIRQIKYKSEWYGRTFLQIDRFFPSSKTCHNCKHVLESLDLKTREWDCPSCLCHNDRDLNAALNIRDEGIRLLNIAKQEEKNKKSNKKISDKNLRATEYSPDKKSVEALATAGSVKQKASPK